MTMNEPKTLLYLPFCDHLAVQTVPLDLAEKIFQYFKTNELFRWQDSNNDCEDRANAIGLLLDAWHIPNAKAWVLGDRILKKGYGCLVNNWKYHVAAALPVFTEDNLLEYVMIDPATADTITPISVWAEQVTETPFSLHFYKPGCYYIFSADKIERDNWHKRDKRNLNWTMHGLSGINGVSVTGKAQLAFNKKKS
ncbi:MAG: protein-glutamine glutaminase family protein [Ginsengibacter sp.]